MPPADSPKRLTPLALGHIFRIRCKDGYPGPCFQHYIFLKHDKSAWTVTAKRIMLD